MPDSRDFFVATSNIRVSCVTEIPPNKYARGESFLDMANEVERVKTIVRMEHKVMDHLPVVAVVQINQTIQVGPGQEIKTETQNRMRNKFFPIFNIPKK